VPSRQIALQVGLQIERLAEAIDNRDSASIRAFASRLEMTAAHGGIYEIESVAADIKKSATENGDLISLLQTVNQLMSLCRSAQKVHAHTSFNRDDVSSECSSKRSGEDDE